MSPRGRILLASLIVLAAGFAALLVRLFLIRYEFGDVYPAYSSLRCDPLGTAAIYESLAEAPAGLDGAKLAVDRNFHPFRKLAAPPDSTIFMFGTNPHYSPGTGKKDVLAIEKFVRSGGRLVIAFMPPPNSSASQSSPASRPAPAGRSAPAIIPAPPDEDDESGSGDSDDEEMGLFGLAHEPLLQHRWGFALDNQPSDPNGLAEPDESLAGLPDVPWPGGIRFSGLGGAWQTAYRCKGSPVIVERRFGRGTIVLAADSFFASNEALKNHRSAGLVAWLIGPSRSAIFDETHLDVSQETGIADLARQYGMGGVLLGLIVLAGLYVWKSMARLVPRRSRADGRDEPPDVVEGKTSSEALTQLLRRAVSRRKLLDACLEEWEKSVPLIGVPAEKLNRIKLELPHVDANDPVGGYKTIAGILKKLT
ncbi:MAG: DUF4350 domain-containing protein [Planctomycetes bacterium]|nr:DUF4350 domain-containing protein [Planctomycetota bacterium]